MKREGRDSEVDTKIDRLALEQECERHPSLYHFWSEEYAQAKSEVEVLQNKLSGLRASLMLRFRKKPPEGVKITESVIVSLVDDDEAVQDLENEIIEAKHIRDKLQSAVNALEHRKKMLDNLCSLWVHGYYSEPKATRRPRSSVDDKDDAARAGLNKKRTEE